MKTICSIAALMLSLFVLSLFADTPTAQWNPSVSPGVATQVLRYGPASGVYTQQVIIPSGLSSFVVSNVQPGITYFTISARLTNGLESNFSTEATYTNKNFAPTNLRLVPSTNDTVSLWIDGPPGNAIIEYAVGVDGPWTGYAKVTSLDYTLPVTRAVLVTGVAPTAGNFFRVRQAESFAPASLPLPGGVVLKPGVPTPTK